MPPSTKTKPDGSHQFLPISLRLEAGAASHAGQVREANEDVYGIFLEERLFVVADGMGGRSAGEGAARIAVDADARGQDRQRCAEGDKDTEQHRRAD